MKQKTCFFLVLLLTAAMVGREARAASGVTADVGSLTFGDQAEGTMSPPQTVTLTNELNGDGVIGAIVLAGQDPQQFLILDDFCSGMVLADQASCSLSVAYGPTVEFPNGVGPAQANLQVTFQSSDALSIALSGNSIVPNIVGSVTFMDFGRKVAGQLSNPQELILTNTGVADLVIGSTGTTGGDTVDFGPSLDECRFQTLAPGASCLLEITMRATELGDRAAQFSIESNDPDQPLFTIDLVGVGTGSGGCALGPGGTYHSLLGMGFLMLILPGIKIWSGLNQGDDRRGRR